MATISNVSSIQAHQTLMNNSANNVANVNTDRFVPADATLGNTANGSVTATVSAGTDNGSTASQTNLSREMTDQMNVERSVEANAEAIRTQDQMYGSLLDIKV